MSVIAALASNFAMSLLYIMYLFSYFLVKDTEAVQYAMRARLSSGYVGTWANDVAIFLRIAIV